LMVLFLLHFSVGVALADLAGLSLVGLALPLAAYRLSRNSGREAVARRGILKAEIADTVRGFEELAVFGALERQVAHHHDAYDVLIAAQGRETRIEAAAAGATLLVVQLTMLTALIISIPLVSRKAMPAPDVAMIALLILASFDAVHGLPAAYRALGETIAAARRIFQIVDTKPAIEEPAGQVSLPTGFGLEFRHVRMRYGVGEPWVLDDVSLTIPQGGSVGIVGSTGSGKTSLCNLVLRFWDFQTGDVLVGGVSIRDLAGESVRSCCAVIAQKTYLFNTSIRENLRLARAEASEAEMAAALGDAGILDEVLAMPDGLDTLVGEAGMHLSGGQARRIAIARAFLKSAPILVLDEPTEGLDAVSERVVVDALRRLMQGRTTILVTHRPQALHNIDQILTLERGKIMECLPG
jgi:ATP-binding cassette, subfamily C, bacterial CydC